MGCGQRLRCADSPANGLRSAVVRASLDSYGARTVSVRGKSSRRRGLDGACPRPIQLGCTAGSLCPRCIQSGWGPCSRCPHPIDDRFALPRCSAFAAPAERFVSRGLGDAHVGSLAGSQVTHPERSKRANGSRLGTSDPSCRRTNAPAVRLWRVTAFPRHRGGDAMAEIGFAIRRRGEAPGKSRRSPLARQVR